MSTKFIEMGIAQCFRCYSMPDDQLSLEIGEGKDIFVGINASGSIEIPNGETIRVRDVIVLGHLSITSTDLENVAVKGRLIARHIINCGRASFENVAIKSKSVTNLRNCQQFKEELREILMDWIVMQRESADKMGLVSVLR